jgi:hypothetical protein
MTHEAGGQGMSEYHDDTLTWSQRQAELLRRVAGGEPPNETPDWENIIEEVLDVGRSEVRAVRSLLFQVLLHRLKVTAWPDARQVEHWQNEALAALVQARDAYRPSMRQHIDIAERYARPRAAGAAADQRRSARRYRAADVPADAGSVVRPAAPSRRLKPDLRPGGVERAAHLAPQKAAPTITGRFSPCGRSFLP